MFPSFPVSVTFSSIRVPRSIDDRSILLSTPPSALYAVLFSCDPALLAVCLCASPCPSVCMSALCRRLPYTPCPKSPFAHHRVQVTESIELSTNESFGMVAVLESQSQCEANLLGSNSFDCEEALTYTSTTRDSPEFLASPKGMAFDVQSNCLYLTDSTTNAVYKYDTAAGSVTEVMEDTYLASPMGVAVDAQGDNLYVVSIVNKAHNKKETATGSVTNLMNTTILDYPAGVAVDAQGDNVYVVDLYNEELYKYETATGKVITLMNSTYLSSPYSVATDAQGDNVYVVDRSRCLLYEYEASTGSVTTLMNSTYLRYPESVAVDAQGDNVYVRDYGNGVYKYETATGSVTTLMDSTSVVRPRGLAVDAQGDDVYVNDNLNVEVYKYEIATAVKSTLQQHSEVTVGWFACGREAQSSLPSSSASALGTCSLNGITWQMDISGADRYFFSSSDAGEHYTSAISSQGCSDETLHTICDYVGDLPPYSCTREVSQGTAEVIGTATANTELFYLIAVTILARLLTSFKPNDSGDGSPASNRAGPSDSGSSPEEGVELGSTNPMHGPMHGDKSPGRNSTGSGRELIQKLSEDLAKLQAEVQELRHGGAVAAQGKVPAGQRRSSI